MTSPIHRLPISPSAPIYHLPADPLSPSPTDLFKFSQYKSPPKESGSNGPVSLREGDPIPPSMLRRSRQIRFGGCFSFVSPLPLKFPYEGSKDENVTIEEYLATLEINNQFPLDVEQGELPTLFSSQARQDSTTLEPQLLSLSHKCHKEWLPQIDIGKEASKERQSLVNILGGKNVMAREAIEGGEGIERVGFGPWSLAYAGHQFGQFAGQLGDGRAISLLSTPTTSQVSNSTGFKSLEIQLKGAGRTPYSRFADGLAVLRSSVREYLGSEAMAALGMPTSRALALVGIPKVNIMRETVENGAIVTRVVSSWIRIGVRNHYRSRCEEI